MKLKNIFFVVALLLFVGLFFYESQEVKPPVKSRIEIASEQAKFFFFNTGTASPSFTKTFSDMYSEQANHLIGCRKHYGLNEPNKDRAIECRQKYRNLIDEAKLQLGIDLGEDRPVNQFDIFYGLYIMDSVYISQDSKSHYASNSLLSTDIATGGKKLKVYAMDCNLQMCEWNVTSDYNEGKGHMVILTNKEKNMQFRYGHTKLTTTESTVITADEVGIILCPDDEGAGITTGCHLDWSYWTKSNGTWKQTEYKDDNNYNPEKRIEELLKSKKDYWYISSYYTPVKGQSSYFLGSYEKDYKMNCHGDCLSPADGGKLYTQADKFQVVACPVEYPLGTKFKITLPNDHPQYPNKSWITTCRDRGGMVRSADTNRTGQNQLDLWYGIGKTNKPHPWIGEMSTKKALVEII